MVLVFIASMSMNVIMVYKQLVGNEFDKGYNTCMEQWMYKRNGLQVPIKKIGGKE